MAEPQQYFFKWNNYLRQLTCALDNHRTHDEFVDVTLLCEGRKITAHKVVLSSCSSYFKDIFSESPHPHPLLIFNFIKYEDLNSIIKFMYQGEVNVKQEGLNSFLQLAKVLSVHGLNTEGTDNDSIPPNIDKDSVPSNIVTSIPEPVLRSTSTDTNSQQKIQTLLKVAQENQAHRNLPTSIDKTTTHPTPSCLQSSYKKRKLTDTDNDNAVSSAGDRDEQAAVNEMETRANNKRISRVFSTRNAIEAMKGGPIGVVDAGAHEAEERDSTGRLKVKGNCYICSKRRPTRKACTLCNKPVCAEHSKDFPQCDRCI